ncbi:MAG TPA: hypothetical protein PKW90_04390 [Myxococcota bacterium]|nr:hypothetical protein [Myxococcota bacterium]
MAFGYYLARWERCVDDEELERLRAYVGRVDPSTSWEVLLARRPPPRSFQLWTDFAPFWDSLLERHGLKGPYDPALLLPQDFGAQDPGAARVVNLRAGSPVAWWVVDAGWVQRGWPGHSNATYAKRIRDQAARFAEWRMKSGPEVEEAIEAFQRRPDAATLTAAYLELTWVEAAAAVCTSGCPAVVTW